MRLEKNSNVYMYCIADTTLSVTPDNFPVYLFDIGLFSIWSGCYGGDNFLCLYRPLVSRLFCPFPLCCAAGRFNRTASRGSL